MPLRCQRTPVKAAGTHQDDGPRSPFGVLRHAIGSASLGSTLALPVARAGGSLRPQRGDRWRPPAPAANPCLGHVGGTAGRERRWLTGGDGFQLDRSVGVVLRCRAAALASRECGAASRVGLRCS